MNLAMIIHKKAGQSIDERLLVKALDQFPSAIGTVTRVNGELHVSNDRGVPDLETMKTALEAAKDHEVYVWLAKIDEQDNIKQEDIQPFVIEDNGKIVLAVMVEGDFAKYNTPNGSDEWANFSTEVLLPTINEYAELSEGNFEKFVEHLHGKMFEKNMMSHVGHRGIIAVIPCEGDALVLSQSNSLLGTYDWGFTTQHLDHDKIADQTPEVKEEPTEKKSFFSFSSKKADTSAKQTETPPAPKTEADKSDPVNTTKAEDKKVSEADKKVLPPKGKNSNIPSPAPGVRVPDTLKGKARKQYIRKGMGLSPNSDELPEGWFKEGFVIPAKGTKPSVVKDLKDLGKAVQSSSSAAAIEAGKKAGEYPAKDGDSSPIPVITEKNKLAVMEFVSKRLDKNSQEITDPKTMQAAEAKIPTFTEATGVTVGDLKKLFFKDLSDFANTYPMEAALLIMELRNEIKIEEPAKTEPQKTEEPVQEPQKIAAAGGKKGGGLFGFGRK